MLLGAVAVCFLLSGFAALLYQAAWLKKLAVVFGTSHLAVATVLAAYMAGLAGGAALAARMADRVRRPILVYGLLEALIGISALLAPALLDAAQALFVFLHGGQPAPASAGGIGQSLYYLCATFLVLAVPTGAMGATLPLLSKYAVSEDRQVGPRIGLLYGINTVGAVLGALAAGFLLLPWLGLHGALGVGAGVNGAVFLVAVYLARAAGLRSGAMEWAAQGKPVSAQSGRTSSESEFRPGNASEFRPSSAAEFRPGNAAEFRPGSASTKSAPVAGGDGAAAKSAPVTGADRHSDRSGAEPDRAASESAPATGTASAGAGRVAGRPGKAPFHWIMPLMLASGAVSFTLEVLWTRLLTHLFGGTVYAFSIMLACFLAGIALGGLLAGGLARSRGGAGPLFVAAQWLVALLSLASYSCIDLWLPEDGGLSGKALYAFFVIVPSTLFIGATYPLAVRIGTTRANQTANASGAIYAWNTIGGIFGALLTGFVILPLLGFGGTLKAAMLVSLLLALIAGLLDGRPRRASGAAASKPDSRMAGADASRMRLAHRMRRGGRRPDSQMAGGMAGLGGRRRWAVAGLSALALLATLLLVQPGRPEALLHAQAPRAQERGAERFYEVGRSATVLLRDLDGFFHLSSNGLSESAIPRRGMAPQSNSQKWLAGLIALARPDAQSMLVIGFGGGVALAGVPPQVRELDVVELEPAIIRANQAASGERDWDPLQDPRLNLAINDARNAILLSSKRYDAILSQPSHPWTGGASHLYTREFLALAKSRLNSGGLFLQWINSQFVDEALLQTLAATVLDQFRHVELYQPERQVLMFLGSDRPIGLWDGPQGAATALRRHRRHYNRLGMRAVEDALAMLTLDDAGLRAFAAGAPLNTDGRNRLAFFSRPAGDGLSADDMQQLFAELDPLTHPGSAFHAQYAGDFNLPYLAERLLAGNFIQRAYLLGQAAAVPGQIPGGNRGQSAAVQKAIIDALGFEHSGDRPRAEAAFRRALRINPASQAARFGLLKLYLGDFAKGDVPRPIIHIANALRGPERRVLEGWVHGAQGRFERVAALDGALAQVAPASPAWPIAIKLRADWRVVRAQQTADPAPAREALDMLDDLLASFSSLDLQILRSGCAWLAGDGPAYIESAWAAGQHIRQRLDQAAEADDALSPAEAAQLGARLQPMLERLRGPLAAQAPARAEAVAAKLQALAAELAGSATI